jgi:nicotinate phosphoribosyltransferase
MITNFAKRADDHNFAFDPIVRSLLDTDFYKLLMLQFIWRYFRDIPVSFAIHNRSTNVRLADEIDEAELRRQLDHARTLRFGNTPLVWLAGNTFYGTRGMFEPGFIEWLRDFRLPPYRLERGADGQWDLSFPGTWAETTLWEIPALSIINELRTRAVFRGMTESELDIAFARAKVTLWDKIAKLRPLKDLTFTEFGTRRRHGYLWQDHVVQTLARELKSFIGTSNILLAFRNDLEPRGTNAHELPMVLGALARHGKLIGPDGPISLKRSQYEVTRLWQEAYGGALLVLLPDTWGTTQFLEDAPHGLADWTGLRVDSKEPVAAGEEYIDWLKARGRDPMTKMLLYSDGLDVDAIVDLHQRFRKRARVTFGWGTLLTNDFRHCHPRDPEAFRPISLVCKVAEVDGHPAVKLSDNLNKAMGPADEIQHYLDVFGRAGMTGAPVEV